MRQDSFFKFSALYCCPFYVISKYSLKLQLGLLVAVICTVKIAAQPQEPTETSRPITIPEDYPESWERLYDLTYEAIDRKEYDQAFPTAEECLKIALKRSDSIRIFKSLRLKASVLSRQNQFDKQIEILIPLIAALKRHDLQRDFIIALNNLANAFLNTGQYDQALVYHLKSLEARKLYGDKLEIARAYHNIGQVYYKLSDFDKAIYFNDENLKLRASIPDSSQTETILGLLNQSLCFLAKKDFERANSLILDAISRCDSATFHENSLMFDFNRGLIAF